MDIDNELYVEFHHLLLQGDIPNAKKILDIMENDYIKFNETNKEEIRNKIKEWELMVVTWKHDVYVDHMR